MRHFRHLRLRPWVFEPRVHCGFQLSQPCEVWEPSQLQLFFGSLSSLADAPRPAHGLGLPRSRAPADFRTLRCAVRSSRALGPSHPAGSASRAQPRVPRLRRGPPLHCSCPLLLFSIYFQAKIEDVVISGISIILFDVLCLKTFLFVFCPIFCLFSGEKYSLFFIINTNFK